MKILRFKRDGLKVCIVNLLEPITVILTGKGKDKFLSSVAGKEVSYKTMSSPSGLRVTLSLGDAIDIMGKWDGLKGCLSGDEIIIKETDLK